MPAGIANEFVLFTKNRQAIAGGIAIPLLPATTVPSSRGAQRHGNPAVVRQVAMHHRSAQAPACVACALHEQRTLAVSY
jgi:hypothetical protein